MYYSIFQYFNLFLSFNSIYYDIRGNLFGKFSQDVTEVMLENLSKVQTDYIDSLKIEVDDGKPIVIMTPFMRRVHGKINHFAEVVFMDSIGGLDSLLYRMFILITHSYMGVLPFGIVIITTEQAKSVARGLRLLLELISLNDALLSKNCLNT